ncbi:MAG: S-layer homology domain-containing protein [Dysosmobacter sp.]
MEWAVDTGLLQGRADGRLDPGGYATRAQLAVILQRFCDSVGKG